MVVTFEKREFNYLLFILCAVDSANEVIICHCLCCLVRNSKFEFQTSNCLLKHWDCVQSNGLAGLLCVRRTVRNIQNVLARLDLKIILEKIHSGK